MKLITLLLCLIAALLILILWIRTEQRVRQPQWWQRPPLPLWPLKLAGVAWLLALLLALIGLLTGCASPCQPTLDPSRLKPLIENPTALPAWAGVIAINCSWSF